MATLSPNVLIPIPVTTQYNTSSKTTLPYVDLVSNTPAQQTQTEQTPVEFWGVME